MCEKTDKLRQKFIMKYSEGERFQEHLHIYIYNFINDFLFTLITFLKMSQDHCLKHWSNKRSLVSLDNERLIIKRNFLTWLISRGVNY